MIACSLSPPISPTLVLGNCSFCNNSCLSFTPRGNKHSFQCICGHQKHDHLQLVGGSNNHFVDGKIDDDEEEVVGGEEEFGNPFRPDSVQNHIYFSSSSQIFGNSPDFTSGLLPLSGTMISPDTLVNCFSDCSSPTQHFPSEEDLGEEESLSTPPRNNQFGSNTVLKLRAPKPKKGAGDVSALLSDSNIPKGASVAMNTDESLCEFGNQLNNIPARFPGDFQSLSPPPKPLKHQQQQQQQMISGHTKMRLDDVPILKKKSVESESATTSPSGSIFGITSLTSSVKNVVLSSPSSATLSLLDADAQKLFDEFSSFVFFSNEKMKLPALVQAKTAVPFQVGAGSGAGDRRNEVQLNKKRSAADFLDAKQTSQLTATASSASNSGRQVFPSRVGQPCDNELTYTGTTSSDSLAGDLDMENPSLSGSGGLVGDEDVNANSNSLPRKSPKKTEKSSASSFTSSVVSIAFSDNSTTDASFAPLAPIIQIDEFNPKSCLTRLQRLIMLSKDHNSDIIKDEFTCQEADRLNSVFESRKKLNERKLLKILEEKNAYFSKIHGSRLSHSQYQQSLSNFLLRIVLNYFVDIDADVARKASANQFKSINSKKNSKNVNDEKSSPLQPFALHMMAQSLIRDSSSSDNSSFSSPKSEATSTPPLGFKFGFGLGLHCAAQPQPQYAISGKSYFETDRIDCDEDDNVFN